MSADSFKQLDAYVAASLLIVTSLYYLPLLFFFVARRSECPIINRSPNIVLMSAISEPISLLANFFLTIFLLLPRISP